MTSTVNTTSPNMTFHNMTIEELNREQVLIRIPAIIVVTITMILGFIGNSLTYYVYGFRLKMTPTYLFVVMLAITDFIACSILCPLTIVIYVYPMMSTSDAICKSAISLAIFTGYCNSGLLCSITVERYRKVCCPLKRQITMKSARILTCCIFLSSAVQGSLVTLSYGSVKKQIYPGIYSHSCTFNILKIYQIVFSILHVLVAISTIILMVVLYAIILRRLKKVGTKNTVANAPPPVSGNNSCQKVRNSAFHLNVVESQTEMSTEASAECSGSNDITQSTEISTTNNISTQKSKRERNSDRRTRESSDRLQRTTVTMMLITVVYIISYIPCTCTVIYSAAVQSLDNMSTVTAFFYWITPSIFFINSCVNPIIYGYRNQQFLDEVQQIFRIRY